MAGLNKHSRHWRNVQLTSGLVAELKEWETWCWSHGSCGLGRAGGGLVDREDMEGFSPPELLEGVDFLHLLQLREASGRGS